MAHNLPEEIIHDILSRLPPKSLIRCTMVCKAWRSTKKQSQLYSLPPQPAILCNSVNVQLDEPREKHCNLHYDNHAFDEYCKLEFPIVPKMNKYLRVVGVCNGLVCLAVDNDCLGYTFMLCNPSIRKTVTLPKPHLSFDTIGPYDACIGFGFDAVTNDYKVVRLITEQSEEPNTFYEVYSLAGGSWSDPCSFEHVCEVTDPRKPQAFVNGAIHFEAFYRSTNGGLMVHFGV
ncbi:F-box protein CPR30-like [Pyrus ussuriensis x Pyrus communis]|uniref:F-box protein CPR30-like n=1 Tax=Pyrus ussuriensis x Pyrus communis TaxID=2448454 RepID=A0A5N5GMN9_9ROSA|nr:F-box protein CPR30-like [Pyrus ussuriensis x Pyrus communis]